MSPTTDPIERAAATLYRFTNPKGRGWPTAEEAETYSDELVMPGALKEMREYYLKMARSLRAAGLLAVPGTPAATTTDQRTAANVLADAIRKQAANRDDLVRMVETQLAEDLHEDQCHCDNYPAACDSGLTRDSLACAAFSPEATIQVLWELGLLALSPAPGNEPDGAGH